MKMNIKWDEICRLIYHKYVTIDLQMEDDLECSTSGSGIMKDFLFCPIF